MGEGNPGRGREGKEDPEMGWVGEGEPGGSG